MASSIVLFESADHEVQLNVELDKKTVWLSQEQMANLFGRSVSAVSRHISNALREGEISAESNLQKMQSMRSDGGLTLYDLDVDIDAMLATEASPPQREALSARRTYRSKPGSHLPTAALKGGRCAIRPRNATSA